MVQTLLLILLLSCNTVFVDAFQLPSSAKARQRGCQKSINHPNDCQQCRTNALQESSEEGDNGTSTKKENNAMAFLRNKGRIGGAANMDFADAMGLDESPSGGTKTSYHENGFQNVRKAKSSYISCTTSGIIDDISEPFPFTSSGNQWDGITDRVVGGVSNGSLTRETIGEKPANVLRGNVSMKNGGGFIQIVTPLSLDPTVDVFVDASEYDGVELEVYCEGGDEENFNVHLDWTYTLSRELQCSPTNPSLRKKIFILQSYFWDQNWKMGDGSLSWDEFAGYGSGPDVTPFVPSLRRLAVVAIGEAKDVVLAVGQVGFYNVI
eukprot:CAMPEP_0201682996 /NCGR_PEP_ID=MMETSP0494-20130426/51901_1 /ASSEMBLY_ACC=CAM_ASM_000839 /TAXON_ID=420259 /ORGANISM="Thalassiosira gravida, Strain GMp14c1" /LENGTH=321 /DNA_ID=CAMNT_0048166763 /DNA_START=95 /DNA_END=1061 /DNA_ORIENTATION=+